MIISQEILNELTAKAKASERLRANLDLRNSPDDQSQRMLNTLEPGTKVEIHSHPSKDESFVLLRGRVRVNTYNDDGTVIESVVLCPEEGLYGVDIPKNVWHNVECLESGSIFFECKEGPFVPHEEEGVLRLQQ